MKIYFASGYSIMNIKGREQEIQKLTGGGKSFGIIL